MAAKLLTFCIKTKTCIIKTDDGPKDVSLMNLEFSGIVLSPVTEEECPLPRRQTRRPVSNEFPVLFEQRNKNRFSTIKGLKYVLGLGQVPLRLELSQFVHYFFRDGTRRVFAEDSAHPLKG